MSVADSDNVMPHTSSTISTDIRNASGRLKKLTDSYH